MNYSTDHYPLLPSALLVCWHSPPSHPPLPSRPALRCVAHGTSAPPFLPCTAICWPSPHEFPLSPAPLQRLPDHAPLQHRCGLVCLPGPPAGRVEVTCSSTLVAGLLVEGLLVEGLLVGCLGLHSSARELRLPGPPAGEAGATLPPFLLVAAVTGFACWLGRACCLALPLLVLSRLWTS